MRISDQQKHKIKENAISGAKSFAAIVFYLWVLLSVLELHRVAVLREVHQTSVSGFKFGFAAINALVLGKFVLIFQDIHLGEQFKNKSIVTSTLFKSATFALLLICLHVLEEIIVGAIHGKSLAASVPQIGGGGLEGIVIMGIVAVVALVPFVLYGEMQRAVGKDELHSLMFGKKNAA